MVEQPCKQMLEQVSQQTPKPELSSPSPRENPSTHPIHPTSSTSTHPRTTVDGLELVDCSHCGQPRLVNAWCSSPACLHRVSVVAAQQLSHIIGERGPKLVHKTTEGVTAARPVTLPVAHDCCEDHVVGGCCDPDDCGPCCERCPTCPTIASWTKTARVSPTLADRQARYLEVREHTLSVDGRDLADALREQARYVRGEAAELRNAVLDYVDDWVDMAHGLTSSDDVTDALTKVRHEIADVVLAAVTLAKLLPDDVTVEACIDEKTEADRGRG